MEIDGLTLHILPAEDEFPEQDREAALLNWLLAEWQQKQKEVDSENFRGNNESKQTKIERA